MAIVAEVTEKCINKRQPLVQYDNLTYTVR